MFLDTISTVCINNINNDKLFKIKFFTKDIFLSCPDPKPDCKLATMHLSTATLTLPYHISICVFTTYCTH